MIRFCSFEGPHRSWPVFLKPKANKTKARPRQWHAWTMTFSRSYVTPELKNVCIECLFIVALTHYYANRLNNWNVTSDRHFSRGYLKRHELNSTLRVFSINIFFVWMWRLGWQVAGPWLDCPDIWYHVQSPDFKKKVPLDSFA